VYYSVTLPGDHEKPELLWQLDTSLSSLRSHNSAVPVALFVHGELSPGLRSIAGRHGVLVHRQETYERRLARFCPRGWPVLSRYPLLHKFLNFAEIAALRPRPSQVLYLDCDTLFFDDVDRLFARYPIAHVVAREEASCARSHLGYDPEYLDEAALAAVARTQGARPTPPFNLGVVLFNAGAWRSLIGLEARLLDYAWRFVVWMALHPVEGRSASYGEGLGVDLLRRADPVTPDDVASALPYPSANRWILDEVALWLALGHVPGLRTADFSRADVLQDGEYATPGAATASAVLCHYFSQNTARIAGWIRGQPIGPIGSSQPR
jgi:hypothetical protein